MPAGSASSNYLTHPLIYNYIRPRDYVVSAWIKAATAGTISIIDEEIEILKLPNGVARVHLNTTVNFDFRASSRKNGTIYSGNCYGSSKSGRFGRTGCKSWPIQYFGCKRF